MIGKVQEEPTEKVDEVNMHAKQQASFFVVSPSNIFAKLVIQSSDQNTGQA